MRELSIPSKKANPIHNDVLKNTIFFLLDQSLGEVNTMGAFTPVTSPAFGIPLLANFRQDQLSVWRAVCTRPGNELIIVWLTVALSYI